MLAEKILKYDMETHIKIKKYEVKWEYMGHIARKYINIYKYPHKQRIFWYVLQLSEGH